MIHMYMYVHNYSNTTNLTVFHFSVYFCSVSCLCVCSPFLSCESYFCYLKFIQELDCILFDVGLCFLLTLTLFAHIHVHMHVHVHACT